MTTPISGEDSSFRKIGSGIEFEIPRDIVLGLLQSSEQFPVDFDQAMIWWDAKTKTRKLVRRDNLIQKLKDNFEDGTDYYLFAPEISGAKRNGRGGHNREHIRLTVDCFKMFGMMISGERGTQIRRYFLRCEAELKRLLETNKKDRLVSAFVSADIQSRKARFNDEFYKLLYQKRGGGWEHRDPKNRPSCVGTWTNQVVYDRFPEGVKDRLNDVNPRIDGRRKHKHHWHLRELGSVHLEGHLPAVMAVARLSPDGDWDRFMRNIDKALPNGEALQMNLLDLLEESEGQVS